MFSCFGGGGNYGNIMIYQQLFILLFQSENVLARELKKKVISVCKDPARDYLGHNSVTFNEMNEW